MNSAPQSNPMSSPPDGAPSGNGYINVDLHHAAFRVDDNRGYSWITWEAKQVKVTVFVDPYEARALAAALVAKFGPASVPSADVSDISVDGRDA